MKPYYASLRSSSHKIRSPNCASLRSSCLKYMKAYMCVICGYVYEEEKGRPEDGIPPGTRWADVPENWKCPDCGAAKSDFEMIEI